MRQVPAVLIANSSTRAIQGSSVNLLRRVVESLPLSRPRRHTLYLGRPDPAAVRSELEHEIELIRSARRAVVVTPETTPLPHEAERRNPAWGWLVGLWFTAVVGDETAMALVADLSVGGAEAGWLLTDPETVHRFVTAVEGELARPDPELLAV